MNLIKNILAKPTFAIMLVVMLSALLMAFCIHPGHNWGDDFAMYLLQSLHLLDKGNMNELYDWNSVSMSICPIGPFLYPMGFPVLLAPLVHICGLDFMLMKGFCSLFFLASLPVVYLLFRPYFSSSALPLLIVFLMAFNFRYVTFADNVLSDFPFLFFSVLSLYTMQIQKSRVHYFLLGILIFCAYQIRDVGVFLLPVLAVFQLLDSTSKKFPFVLRVLPYLIFFILLFVLRRLLPGGNENHLQHLFSRFSFELIAENIIYYFKLTTGLFFFKHWILLGLPVLLLIGVGAISNTRQHGPFLVFTLLNLCVLMVWPYKQGFRFLFPLIPFLLFFALQGGLVFWDKILHLYRKWVFPFLITMLVAHVSVSLGAIFSFALRDTNEAISPEMQEIYVYVNQHVGDEYVVGFIKPRALWLFSGVRSVCFELNEFNSSLADFMLVEKTPGLDISRFKVQKEFEQYYLLTRDPLQH